MNKSLVALLIIPLLVVGIPQFNNTQIPTQTSSQVSLIEFVNCMIEHSQTKYPCQDQYNFISTLITFKNLTENYSESITAECQLYQKYFFMSTSQNQLNYKNYFEKCFHSSQVLKETVQLDSCFETTFYNPIYIKCAGF